MRGIIRAAGMANSRLSAHSPHSVQDVKIAAGDVLRAFPLDVQTASFDCPASAQGFSGASIIRVQTIGRMYCLRRWPRAGLPNVRLRELHHFLGHLQHSGISVVPVPVMSLTGDTLVFCGDTHWQLEPWMPGTADFVKSPADERLRAAMQMLARVHCAAEQYVARAAGHRWFWRAAAAPSPAVRERLSLIADWTPRRIEADLNRLAREPQDEFRTLSVDLLHLYRSTVPVVEAELRALQNLRVRLHPCFRDVWHDHLLFSGDELTGLIDPAATRTENVAADLSRLLGSLLGDDEPRWKIALNAYSAVRPLTDQERRLITCLDHSSVLLSGLTWIDRRLNAHLSDADLPRVIPRLRVVVGRLQHLAAKCSTV